MSTSQPCADLLVRMVGFDTVNAAISGRAAPESALADFLAAQAGQSGLATARLPVPGAGFNLLVTHEVGRDLPWLLFVSHLDTVSAEHMSVDPFAGRMQDGRLYGRGACDTKASGAAMLSALVAYRRTAVRPRNVALLFTVDEEKEKTGIRAFVEHDLPALGWRPAGVIVGEPTELGAVVAHNGVVRWALRTQGVAAHSSTPALGRSAIRMMVRVIEALESRYIAGLAAAHPLTGPAACSINLIQGGTQVNIIPDACRIEIDRRVVPGEDPDNVLPSVERVLQELRREEPDLRVVQDPPFVDPPLDPRGNDRFIASVQSALAELGLPRAARGAPFGTEASTLSRAGIPAVVLGPGSIAQAHAESEWVSLDQLNRAVDVYLQLMSQPGENDR